MRESLDGKIIPLFDGCLTGRLFPYLRTGGKCTSDCEHKVNVLSSKRKPYFVLPYYIRRL